MDTRPQWFLLIIGVLALGGILISFYFLGKSLESSIYDKIEFIELDQNYVKCINAVCLSEGCVINNLEEYNNLIEILDSPECEQFSLPKIDFSQYALLGKSVKATGCEREFIREVERADGTKKILYKIDVKERGFCKLLAIKNNWILIPKIPSGYKLEFFVRCGRIKECD